MKSALTSSRGLEIGGMEVEAANGVVTLDGTVDKSSEKDRAAILALESTACGPWSTAWS